MPALLEFVALTLLYCLIPNCAVRWRDGALGAAVATIAIEILKVGFSIYIGISSFYQTVYGALAIIPIFLLWMYISWMAVLLGAVVAAALPNWRIDERVGPIPSGGVRLGFSLALIASLARAQRRGEVQIDTGARRRARRRDDGRSTSTMRPLAEAGFAAHTQEGRWVLVLEPRDRDVARPLRGAAPAARRPLDWDRFRPAVAAPGRCRRWIASSRRRLRRCR